MINWQAAGTQLAGILISIVASLVIGVLIFRKVVAPEFEARYTEAQQTISNMAKLAGVKSNEFNASKNIEKLVSEDFIKHKIPELELVKLAVSPATWEQIEETIENNPEAIIQLWEKWGPHFTKNADGSAVDNEPATFG